MSPSPLRLVLIGAALALVPALLPGLALAQMEFDNDIPSLTGAREAEMIDTYAFTKERPRMYAPVELLHLPVSPYTEMDDEHPWSDVRADAALRYSRYTLGRCGIVVDRGELQHVPRTEMEAPNPKHLRGAGAGETLVYFVNEVPGRFIGSADASKTKFPFPALSVEDGIPVLTVLPHLLGRRLNLTTSETPYSMMLTDRTLKTAFGSALTASAGFFDPRRFGFSDDECDRMREALLRETQCFPRAHVFDGRGSDFWNGATMDERRRGRRGQVPWPLGDGLGKAAPDDVVVSPTFTDDGLIVFALRDQKWRGFLWQYGDPIIRGLATPRAEVYRGFEQAGGLGLGVHPSGHEIALLTFAEGPSVQVNSLSWERNYGGRGKRPARADKMPCDALLTSGPVGQGASMPLGLVCHDRVWRVWKQQAADAFPLPSPARWASMTRRCNDDAQLWLGLESGELALFRLPAFGPPEALPLPLWATYPAVREVPFSATWGGTPRALDRVNIRRFDATQSPRWLPAQREPTPTEGGLWVRFEDAHGPGWLGFVDGQLRVE